MPGVPRIMYMEFPFHIFQTRDMVAMTFEWSQVYRVVYTNGSKPRAGFDFWMGDSRGHWEGDTLVVDTINFTDRTAFRGSSENLHVVERFTRLDAETIKYEFTVDDPSTWAKPWSAEVPMTKIDGPIFEYACHEGNYGMRNNLSGARAEEKKAEQAALKQ